MIYLITGAAGFVGRAVTERLLAMGQKVRALVLKGDPLARYLPKEAEQVEGDLLTGEGLEAFFALPEGEKATVVHTAAVISIAWDVKPIVRKVNVGGTRRIVQACVRHGYRLIHVASVHAIREKPKGQTMEETSTFEPDLLVGGYAKTKAEAAALVTDAVVNDGLNACIVMPSGIFGPGDYACNNLSTMMRDVLHGRLPVGIRGGYNFVDVRDVADGIVELCKRADIRGCFNLTGHTVSIRQYFESIYSAAEEKVKRVRCYIPAWLAMPALPVYMLMDKLQKRTPVFTRYALYTLTANASFSHEKAERVLGYHPRPFDETVRDTVRWMRAQGKA